MSELEQIEKRQKRIEIKGQTRDFVFGIQDGLISILGLITGVFGAFGDQPKVVVVTGITGAIAAAISMAAGSLLSAEAERDLLLAEIHEAKEDFEKAPYVAQQTLMNELTDAGLEKPQAYQVVKILSEKEDTLFQNFRSMVLDLPSLEEENPWVNATVMFLAFIIGALFPIVPFLITSGTPAYIGALISTGLALFAMGAVKGYFSKDSIIKSGIKFFIIAVIAGVLSELVGSIVTQGF
ncbi:MAG: VIT1/CCC1 transporter family protein [Candidatus Heimdallarchaeota archaeon]|nr:VIT1/CCC1 transporter family protein [Candidatus Heimdallarchaeota archaeon]